MTDAATASQHMTKPASGFFAAFAFALLGGIAALWWERVPRLTSVVPIALYGMYLIVVQRRSQAVLTSTVKDSPYFLGFILTMIGLYRIFSSIPTQPEETPNVGAIAVEAAAAILATVVGLFFRQAIWSYHRAEARGEAVLEEMSRHLQDHAAQFAERQVQLVQLIGQFIDSHRQLWAQEEKALKRYVTQLEAGGQLLNKIEKEYPERIQLLVEAVEKSAATLEMSAVEAANRVHEAGEKFAKAYTERSGTFLNTVGDATQGVSAAGENMTSAFEDLSRVITNGSERLRSSVNVFADVVASYPHALDESATALRGVADATNSLGAGIRAADQALQGLDGSTRGLTESLAVNHKVVHDEILRRAGMLRTDMDQIDQILDEFVQLMRNRIRQVRFE